MEWDWATHTHNDGGHIQWGANDEMQDGLWSMCACVCVRVYNAPGFDPAKGTIRRTPGAVRIGASGPFVIRSMSCVIYY